MNKIPKVQLYGVDFLLLTHPSDLVHRIFSLDESAVNNEMGKFQRKWAFLLAAPANQNAQRTLKFLLAIKTQMIFFFQF